MAKQVFLPVILASFFAILIFLGDSMALALHSAIYRSSKSDISGSLPRIEAYNIRNGVLEASVYSKYPYNFRDITLIAVGKEEGVISGSSVVTEENNFYGIVHEVFDHYSSVITPFDINFRIPVRIGDSAEDALLIGGTSPNLTLISSDADILPGDLVYTAGPEAPYGTIIGVLRSIEPSSDLLFKEGDIDIVFDPREIKRVKVIPRA